MARAKTIFTIILFALAEGIIAQSAEDFKRLGTVTVPSESHSSYHGLIDSRNEFTGTVSLLFLFYKQYFSSQDGMNCTFSPSCSVYALKAVNRHGLLRGGLAAADRLTRCNGLNQHQYPIDMKTRRFYDPVE